MDEIIKNYRTTIALKCSDLYNKAISKGHRFDWNENAFVWFGTLIKPGDEVLKELRHTLDIEELRSLSRQLESIAQEEFEKLKIRIDEKVTTA